MQDYDFTPSPGTGEPYYYVHIRGDEPIGKTESRFYRFETAPEAAALYQFLRTEHPDYEFSLGVHRDYTRRADIVERIEGADVLSEDFKTTSPWKDDPSVANAAIDLSRRLSVAWKVDRTLAGRPVLVPNEKPRQSSSTVLEGKVLKPDVPGDPKSSIVEVSVLGLGWMSLEDLKSLASGLGRGTNRRLPKVGEVLVNYEVADGAGGGSAAIRPAEYEFMAKCYLETVGKGSLERSGDALNDLKQEAKARVRSRICPPSKLTKPIDHVL